MTTAELLREIDRRLDDNVRNHGFDHSTDGRIKFLQGQIDVWAWGVRKTLEATVKTPGPATKSMLEYAAKERKECGAYWEDKPRDIIEAFIDEWADTEPPAAQAPRTTEPGISPHKKDTQ